MKQTTLLTVTFTFLLSYGGIAQEPNKVHEPEYVAQPHYIDSTTGALVPLERQVAVRKTRNKALGYAGGSIGYEIQGGKSPVRFHSASKIEFVVRVESLQTSPEDILRLLILKAKKERRELITTKIKPMGLGSTTDPSAGAVAFAATRFGESSFRITPTNTLPAGEYAIQMAGALGTFFCFGVDL